MSSARLFNAWWRVSTSNTSWPSSFNWRLRYTVKTSVDIWLNNSPPQKLLGTSDKKFALNAGINCSVLDGWCGRLSNGQMARESLGTGEDAYTMTRMTDWFSISISVIRRGNCSLLWPQDANGIPYRWIEIWKRRSRQNAPLFNTDRMVTDYVTRSTRLDLLLVLYRVCICLKAVIF